MIKIPNKKNYDFCNLNISSSVNAELFFYGEIVSSSWDAWQMEDQYPENVKSLIDDIGDRDIDIHINSPGGNVFAGCAIYNLLKNAKGTKTVYIDGVAASISSIIAMAGDEIIIPENAYLMIHKPMLSISNANANELRQEADLLDKFEAGILNTYMTKTLPEITEAVLAEKLEAETWLSGQEASEIFTNITVSAANQAAAKIDVEMFRNYKNIPQKIKNKTEKKELEKPDMTEFKNFENLLNIKYTKNEEEI